MPELYALDKVDECKKVLCGSAKMVFCVAKNTPIFPPSLTELIPSLRALKLALLLMGVAVYGCLVYVLVAVLHDLCIVCSLLYLLHALLVANYILHCCCGKPRHEPAVKKRD